MNTYIKILLGTCCSFSILSCSNNLDETVYYESNRTNIQLYSR